MPRSPLRRKTQQPFDDAVTQRVVARLESWFRTAQRDLPWRRSYDPYAVWVSEIMLQQTRMEVVVPYFERFLARFPDVSALARAERADVLALWSGLGYYRRATMLHEGAREVVEKFGGEIPRDVAALQTIRGIGRYTAGAIASIAFEERAPIVDGNVQRVVSRLTAFDAPAASAQLVAFAWRAAEQLVAAADSPRVLNQALMEHGATVCTPQLPSCDACALADVCQTSGERATAFPRVAQRRERVLLRVPLFVVRDASGRVLLERSDGALMSGMYHLPHGSSALFADASPRFTPRESLGEFRHTITHRAVTFELFDAAPRDAVSDRAGDAVWVQPSERLDIPHASYVTKALRIVATGSGHATKSSL